MRSGKCEKMNETTPGYCCCRSMIRLLRRAAAAAPTPSVYELKWEHTLKTLFSMHCVVRRIRIQLKWSHSSGFCCSSISLEPRTSEQDGHKWPVSQPAVTSSSSTPLAPLIHSHVVLFMNLILQQCWLAGHSDPEEPSSPFVVAVPTNRVEIYSQVCSCTVNEWVE